MILLVVGMNEKKTTRERWTHQLSSVGAPPEGEAATAGMKPRSTLLRHTAREGDSNALGVPLYSRNLSGAAYGTAGVVLQVGLVVAFSVKGSN